LDEVAHSKNTRLTRHLGSSNLLETPLDELGKSWITPNNLFFVLNRSSIEVSSAEAEHWQINFGGLVETPLQFRIQELFDSSKFTQIELPSYIQCCGNGRRFFKPAVEGVPWGHGAIGNAVWSGISLADILKTVGLRPNVRHIILAGKDAALDSRRPYIKSIPLEKAMSPHTILASRMNGEALPVVHGGPVRLIVPGWGGTYSLKWLTHVKAAEQPWNGFWMNPAFRIPVYSITPGNFDSPFETKPFTEFSVSSVITRPLDYETVKSGTASIQGYAWTGECEVAAVNISTDGGQTWHPATLGPRRSSYAWTQWAFTWHAAPGTYVLMARAKDSLGKTQPLEQDNWNPVGYGWHAVHSIRVSVK
jgi:DMSO/TMAO reductase YedYZ molybdopterin-dependent catalytic subunit